MNEQFKMTGVVEKIFDTEQVNDKFKKRSFVVNDMGDKYPQAISFQVTQDKVDKLDSIAEGQEVEVSFNLRGRQWTSPQGDIKYFNSLEAWRIEAKAGTPSTEKVAESSDDMPF